MSRKYERLAKLGTGAFANVYKCYDKRSRKYKAIKVVKGNNGEGLNSIMEYFIVKHISHKFLVWASESYIVNNTLYMVQEIGINDLFDWRRKHVPSDKQIRDWIFQLVDALLCLWSLDVTHTDLKTNNILLMKDGKIRLCDFGLSKLTSREQVLSCSPEHRPPEVWRYGDVTTSIDVWGLGCTIFEMMYGRTLFEEASKKDSLENIHRWGKTRKVLIHRGNRRDDSHGERRSSERRSRHSESREEKEPRKKEEESKSRKKEEEESRGKNEEEENKSSYDSDDGNEFKGLPESFSVDISIDSFILFLVDPDLRTRPSGIQILTHPYMRGFTSSLWSVKSMILHNVPMWIKDNRNHYTKSKDIYHLSVKIFSQLQSQRVELSVRMSERELFEACIFMSYKLLRSTSKHPQYKFVATIEDLILYEEIILRECEFTIFSPPRKY